MNVFFTIIFFILGASVGSFINVLIYRSHHFETGIIGGRSKCRDCHKDLEPRDLVPILSYLMLGGKCRKCNKDISKSYLIIELLSGAVFAFLYSKYPFIIGSSVHGVFEGSPIDYSVLFQLLYYLLISFGLIIIFFYDLFYKEIPDMFSLPLIGLAILGGVLDGELTAGSMLMGAALGLAFFGGQFLVSKGRWIGSGDIRLGVFMGVFLGWKLMLLALFLSYMIGAIWSMGLVIFRKFSSKSEIAFGPFLIIGTVTAQVYGHEIIEWYLNFAGL